MHCDEERRGSILHTGDDVLLMLEAQQGVLEQGSLFVESFVIIPLLFSIVKPRTYRTKSIYLTQP